MLSLSSLEILNGLGVPYKAVVLVQPLGYQALLVLIHRKNLRKNQYMYDHDSLAFISYISDRLFWHWQVHIFTFCVWCTHLATVTGCQFDSRYLLSNQPPYCTLSAAATDQCWKDHDCTLLKYFPYSFYIELT